ncbi:MAG TPA: hypothetical protein VG736_04180 [Vicinamibacterales bacterium]|jgi:hypothetical protein|nr:hypothetical protein [Vicinamibacterales bacterium]
MPRDRQVRDAIDRFLASVRQDTDVRLQALASELLRIVEGEPHTSRVDVERAGVEIARAVARGGEHARHDLIARVVAAIRQLDTATTLRGILDALTDGASGEASRVATMLVDGGMLRRYRHHGFGPGLEPVDTPVEGAPLIAGAIEVRQPAKIPAVERVDTRVPPFMRVPAGHVGQVIPIVVGQEVVAVVYVEGLDRTGVQPGEPVWAQHVEVLVRHASARLETVTSLRTVEVLAGPS